MSRWSAPRSRSLRSASRRTGCSRGRTPMDGIARRGSRPTSTACTSASRPGPITCPATTVRGRRATTPRTTRSGAHSVWSNRTITMPRRSRTAIRHRMRRTWQSTRRCRSGSPSRSMGYLRRRSSSVTPQATSFPASVTFTPIERTARITPAEELRTGTKYKVTLTSAIVDWSNNRFAGASWSFTTSP